MSEELHTLAGLYVVDALDDDERARFDAHLADCAACQEEVAEFQATTGRLSQLMAERPPQSLRAAIMARVAVTPQESAVRPRPGPAPRAASGSGGGPRADPVAAQPTPAGCWRRAP